MAGLLYPHRNRHPRLEAIASRLEAESFLSLHSLCNIRCEAWLGWLGLELCPLHSKDHWHVEKSDRKRWVLEEIFKRASLKRPKQLVFFLLFLRFKLSVGLQNFGKSEQFVL